MNEDYKGFRILVSPRALGSGGTVYDVQVCDGFFKPLWYHTVTDRETAQRCARKWIEGTDRTVGIAVA